MGYLIFGTSFPLADISVVIILSSLFFLSVITRKIKGKTGTKKPVKGSQILKVDLSEIVQPFISSADYPVCAVDTNEKLKLLYEVTKELATTLDVNKIYEILHGFALKTVPCDEFLVSSFNEETKLLKCVALWGKGQWIDPGNLPELPLKDKNDGNQSYVIHTGKSKIINELAKANTKDKTIYYFNEKGKIVKRVPKDIPVCNSGIFIPLRIDNKVIGVLQIFSYEHNAYNNGHLDLLETISTHISSALTNAKLFNKANEEIKNRKKTQYDLEQTQQQIVDSNARLQLLYDSSRELSSTLDKDELYHKLYRSILKAMPCEGYIVSKYDPETKMISCAAACAGDTWLDVNALPVIPLDAEGHGVQSRVIMSGKSAIINDLDEYQKTTKNKYYVSDEGELIEKYPPDENHSRSGIYVPLKINNRVAGTVVVHSSEINVYNEDHLKLLETLSLHLSSSLANAELYKKAQDEIKERKKIEETLQLTKFSVDKATDAITWVDTNGKFIDVNDAACVLFNMKRPDFVNMNVWDFDVHASGATWDKFKRMLKEKKSDLSETEIRIGNNKSVPVEIQANYILFKGKEYIVGFVRNISERKHTEDVIKASEERYRTVFEQSSLGVCLLTLPPALKFIKVNKVYAQMMGYTEEELLNMSVIDLTFPADINIPVRKSPGSSDRIQMEQRNVKKNGDIIWVKVAVSIIKNNGGAPLYGMAIVSDISAQKKAEEMLKISEDRYRSVVSALSEGVVLYNTNGKVITFNDSANKIMGLSRKEFEERNLTDKRWKVINEVGDIFKGEDYPSSISLKTGKSLTGVIMGIYKPDGELRWISVNSEPLLRKNSEVPYAAVSSFTDITEQKLAEEALRVSEERYRGIFEQTNIGISIITLKDWRYVTVNKAYCDMLGYTEDDLKKMTLKDITHPHDLIIQDQSGQFDNQSSFVIEKRLRKKNGEYIWLNVASSIIRDKEDKPIFRQAIVENIDLQKKAEFELKFQEEKLKSLYYLSNRPFTDEKEIMKYALEEVIRLTGSGLGYLHLVNENETDIDETIWSESISRQFSLDSKYNFKTDSIEAWAECVKTKKPLIYNDEKIFVNFKFPENHPSIKKLLSVPIYESGKLVIIIGIGNKNENYNLNDAFQLQLFSEETWRIIVKNRKEKQLEKSLKEKEIMLKEIHHRVKNNLQIISALLNLKSMSVENPESQSILIESRDRVQSMALVHKKLYSSIDFSGINFRSYVQDLSYILLTNSNLENNVHIVYDIEDFSLDINDMVPLGLILNEMLTNSFKHAFIGRDKGEIRITAQKADEGSILINYSDDGIGLPDLFDPANASSLGMQLIFSLTGQLQGRIDVIGNQGVHYKLTIRGS